MPDFKDKNDLLANPTWGHASAADIYLDIVGRRRQIQEIIDIPSQKIPERIENLGLVATQHGSVINIKINEVYIPIGHFDPVSGRIKLWREYVDGDDVIDIMPMAIAERDEAIAQFNNTSSNGYTRIDYEHPAVQWLHSEQNTVLHESGLAQTIADIEAERFTPDFSHISGIDEDTSLAIGIRPHLFKEVGVDGNLKDKAYPATKVVLRLIGPYISKDDLVQRQPSRDIVVGFLDPEGQVKDIVPRNLVYPQSIVNKLDKLLEQTLAVKELIPEFDTYRLGIKTNPAPKMEQ
jgi:hypothetical protein